MATTLRDFIAQRETEIRDQQKALKSELRELQIAKAALDAQPASSPGTTAASSITIKDMAREVLSGMPNGLTSSGILDGIKKSFSREIERTSLSPQLSRLKEDGELVLEGEVWFTKQNYEIKVWGEAGKMVTLPVAQLPEQSPTNNEFDDDVPF